jgi:hypothetical protein
VPGPRLCHNRRLACRDPGSIGARPLLLLTLCTCACGIAPERVNTGCVWTSDAARPLDLTRRTDDDHLLTDAAVAEDLAIRYAFQAGSIWSMYAEESLRLGSNHLSYRAFDLPWLRHPAMVVVAGTVLFWLVALARSQMIESGFASARFSRADHEPVQPEREGRAADVDPGR